MSLPRYFFAVLFSLGLCACNGNGQSRNQPSDPEMKSTDTLIADTDTTVSEITEAPKPDSVPVPYLIGKFEPSGDSLFVKIDRKYTAKSNIYMHREAYASFERMHAAAAADGIRLHILSATRNFEYQRSIWEAKWTGARLVGGKNLGQSSMAPPEKAKTILRYSSMPGTSRHHWGTDIDLNDLENSYFESGEGKKVYDWLVAHAHEYGFCQPYSPKGSQRPNGYEEEKWHWSFMPVASRYLAAYREYVTYDDVQGFKGDESAEPLDVITNYVLGINLECLNWTEP